jgi:hypothetical protein
MLGIHETIFFSCVYIEHLILYVYLERAYNKDVFTIKSWRKSNQHKQASIV